MLESDWLPPEKVKAMSLKLQKPFTYGIRTGIISSYTPQQIDDYVKKLAKVLLPGGGCTITCDQIPRDTPPENINAYVNAMRKYGTYPILIM